VKRLAFFSAGILSVLLVLGIACGGAAAPAATKAPAPKATAAPAPKAVATPTQAPKVATTPAPVAPPAAAATHEIASVGEEFKFDKDKLTAKAGTAVVLRFKNNAKNLQHNWVLVKAGTKDEVATAGTAAGPTNDWIPRNDARVLASTKLVDPGKTGDVQFTAPAAGTYQFVCTFPGHNFTMFGEFTATP